MSVRQTTDPITPLDALLIQLGYKESPFYREVGAAPESHLLRDASRASVRGAYFVRTTSDEADPRQRPAVYVAEASSVADARKIHRSLWNQGTTPFVIVSLPDHVRVYTPFAYDENDASVGQVDCVPDLSTVAARLKSLRADSIDDGTIWEAQAKHVADERRVDRTLLGELRALSAHLIKDIGVDRLTRPVAHALVGRFVYLYYLRARRILSDQWLDSVGVKPESVFSPHVRLADFQRLTAEVDKRFNGHIFPIDWSAPTAPSAAAVRAAARTFAGESVSSGQKTLFSVFDFSYIPIEFLSAIYQQFLRDTGEAAVRGAFYTTESLTDYVLAEVDSVRPLKIGMRVLDPCCGSGVFLVLAYRRLVEQAARQKHGRLTPSELRDILTTSIFGVERDRDACLVAEFSLILTLLSYVDPPELHKPQNRRFTFPSLHNSQIFEADFFDPDSIFGQHGELRFDWIVGNPPWGEIDESEGKQAAALAWIRSLPPEMPVARNRISEAFTWRVRERLSDNGVVGLLIAGSSLTNDDSHGYRKAFFGQHAVHKITNLANLTYVAFPSAKEPGAAIVYSCSKDGTDIVIHFGPLLVNQATAVTKRRGGRTVPWALTISASEIQTIRGDEAMRGRADTWKLALLGTPRDRRAIEQLGEVFPVTLKDLACERGWSLALGLQLRQDAGKASDPNVTIGEWCRSLGTPKEDCVAQSKWFERLNILRKPPRLKGSPSQLQVPSQWLVPNSLGTFVRQKGGWKGLSIARAPHLFLWNEFAAFSDEDFIFPHPSPGLAAPPKDADWLRAIAVLWTSSVTLYVLVLRLSSSWGIGRSVIDLGDVELMPMPCLTTFQVAKLATLHRRLVAEGMKPLQSYDDWQEKIDDAVADILAVPPQIMLLAKEFREFRFPLLQGRAPSELTTPPPEAQLQRYAERLKHELDVFIERRTRRHDVTVRTSAAGTVASVELIDDPALAAASVRGTSHAEQSYVRDILRAAERECGQWSYVTRSVRIFAGRVIHVCKPSRRLEWTETQALLDATDIIAEVASQRGRET